jgi:hypothetical protein
VKVISFAKRWVVLERDGEFGENGYTSSRFGSELRPADALQKERSAALAWFSAKVKLPNWNRGVVWPYSGAETGQNAYKIIRFG